MATCVSCTQYYRNSKFYNDDSLCESCSKDQDYNNDYISVYFDSSSDFDVQQILHPGAKTEAHYTDE